MDDTEEKLQLEITALVVPLNKYDLLNFLGLLTSRFIVDQFWLRFLKIYLH